MEDCDVKMKSNKKNDNTSAEDTSRSNVVVAAKEEKEDNNNDNNSKINEALVDCELGGAGVATAASCCDNVASASPPSAVASATSIEKRKTSSNASATSACAKDKVNEKDSKNKKAAASLNKDTLLDSIQDLPSSDNNGGDAQANLYEGPGAHAVPGRPSASTMDPEAQQPSLLPLHLNNNISGGNITDDEDPLINEAVVVLEDDDEEICGGSATVGLQQQHHPTGTIGVCSAATEKTNELVIEVDKVIQDIDVNNSKNKPHGRQERVSTKHLWILLLVLAMILALTFLLIAVLVILPSQNDNNSSNADDELFSQHQGDNHHHPNSNNVDPDDYVIPFQEDLNRLYIDDIQMIGSPANLANQWMMEDPNLDSYSPPRQRQRFTLVALYYNLGGPQQYWYNSHHWLSYEINECYWYSTSLLNYGMDVCDDENNVISVSLSSNNLTGTFPLYFSHLPNLRVFDLEDNNIHGIIPSLYTSSYLEVFAVAHNDLQGQLIGKGGFAALDLRVARLNDNRFTGSLIVFQWLTKLEYVNVTSNRFNGMIPPQLQECEHLTYLGLGHNLYEGPVPSELGLLSNLYEMDVSGNPMVNGTVPEELANLTNLNKLDISNTSIQGPIPQELCTKQDEENLEIVANCNSTSGLVQCCPMEQERNVV